MKFALRIDVVLHQVRAVARLAPRAARRRPAARRRTSTARSTGCSWLSPARARCSSMLIAFCVIDRLPDDSVTITRSPSLHEHAHLGEAGDLVDARVGARVRREDHAGVERHGNTIGHGDGCGAIEVRDSTGSRGGSRRHSAVGTRKCAADLVAQRRDPLEEIHQVFVQPELDDVVGAAVVQLGVQLARRRARSRVELSSQSDSQRLVDEVHAGMQRARHVVAQDQELGHAARRDDVAVDLAVGLEAGHRAQQRAPLVVVDRAADVGRLTAAACGT